MTHICISKLTTTGSDDGLSPGRCQSIIWTNAGILLTGPLGTNFSEIFLKIHAFSLKKKRLQLSSGKWRPIFLGLNVLRQPNCIMHADCTDIITWKYISHNWPFVCGIHPCPEQSVEQTVKSPIIWETMTPMWCQCNENTRLDNLHFACPENTMWLCLQNWIADYKIKSLWLLFK